MWRIGPIIVVVACSGTAPPISIDGPVADGASADARPARLFAFTSGGPNIETFSIDNATGELTSVASTPAFAANTSFLAFSPSGANLYAVSEATNQVAAYAIDRASGTLTFINAVGSGGTGPAHVAIDRAGHFVLVANYGNGNISVLPVDATGRLGAAQQTLNAGANAHQMIADPSNRFVFVPCLGSDYVAQYAFDSTTGMLAPNSVPHLPTAAGAGPRHLAFTHDGAHAYLIDEKASTMTALAFDGSTGRLAPLDTLSTLPTTHPTSTGAEVVVDPTGRFVYGSNRGDDSIAAFTIDGGGAITAIGDTPTAGMTPRSFAVDPAGRLLFVANQGSNTVVAFAIDASTGMLARTAAAPVTVTAPAFVGVLAL